MPSFWHPPRFDEHNRWKYQRSHVAFIRQHRSKTQRLQALVKQLDAQVAQTQFNGQNLLDGTLSGDRALSLIPTWVLFLVWIFATGMTLSGRLSGDVVISGLVAGLVLVVILMGFTVTQFAFRSLDPIYAGAPTELQARSMAQKEN